ncbi:MAG: putative eukaryotic translation initiation factor eIF1a-like protein [Aureobasidium pullulans]|nr:MAG: putative eukaryotic translation initiation factor eIF1a-like protein [Aureobasidium pullulans]THV86030.1 hypothetical protein D6D29_01880 [Aureobasidium pullulans]
MATQADIDGLASKLMTSAPLSWVVADCPVVAVYDNKIIQESEFLGQPLDRNGCGDILRLWIGSNQVTREMLVTLTIRIRASPVRKKTRRQGRLMFLIVPVESLRLHSTRIDYSSLKKLPQCLLDVPNDVQSAKTQLLHMSLDLGPTSSDVIMPEYQCRPNVMPQAMVLLRKLKLLSESSSFQLYTNQDRAIQAALQNVSTMLAGSASITTPSVVLTGFYPGGRSACRNLWHEQGWFELEDTNHNDQKRIEASGTKHEEIVKSHDPQPPPPYEFDDVLPPKFASSRQADEPHLPPTASFSPEQRTSDFPHTAPFSPHLPPAGAPPPVCAADQLARPLAVAHPSAGSSQIFAPSSRLHHSTPEPSLSPNYSATFLSGFPSASPLRKISNVLQDQRGTVTRDGSCLSVQVAASICDRAFSDWDFSTRANTPSGTDRVPDSLTRKRLPSYPSEEGPTSPAKRLATATANTRPLLLNGMNVESSPTVADTIPIHAEQVVRELANNDDNTAAGNQMSQWLMVAWNYCPTAHYIFIAELLKYGSAISNNQAEDLATCHVNCTSALLAHCTVQRLAVEQTDAAAAPNSTISDETKALLRWLYILRPGADMKLFDSLLQLSISEHQLLHASTKEEHSLFTNSYKQYKAIIVSQACTTLGQETLEKNDEEKTSANMLREEVKLRTHCAQAVII